MRTSSASFHARSFQTWPDRLCAFPAARSSGNFVAASARLPLAGDLKHAREGLFDGKLGGVYTDGVGGCAQRRVVARGVAAVALVDVCERLLEALRARARSLLVEAAARALFGGRGEEELHVRRGEDDGADVAPVEDDAARPPHLALAANRSEEHTSELKSRFGISYAV